jgi:hypothetical protein
LTVRVGHIFIPLLLDMLGSQVLAAGFLQDSALRKMEVKVNGKLRITDQFPASSWTFDVTSAGGAVISLQ